MESVKVTPQFVFPVRPFIVTSGFGQRASGKNPAINGFHGGIDLDAELGQSVYASADGVVLRSYTSVGDPKRKTKPYGERIIIDHGQGVWTSYCHLNARIVKEQHENGTPWRVKAGELIGEAGNTGFSFGVHVHFEVFVHGTPVDPMSFLEDALALRRAA